jgi:hypothetical protein
MRRYLLILSVGLLLALTRAGEAQVPVPNKKPRGLKNVKAIARLKFPDLYIRSVQPDT